MVYSSCVFILHILQNFRTDQEDLIWTKKNFSLKKLLGYGEKNPYWGHKKVAFGSLSENRSFNKK